MFTSLQQIKTVFCSFLLFPFAFVYDVDWSHLMSQTVFIELPTSKAVLVQCMVPVECTRSLEKESFKRSKYFLFVLPPCIEIWDKAGFWDVGLLGRNIGFSLNLPFVLLVFLCSLFRNK